MIVYLNGTLVERSKAHLSLDDRGFLFGEGAYEVTRAVHGSLFEPERHIARLERTLRGLEIDPDPLDLAELFAVSERLVRDNGFADGEATVYLQITRGAWFPRSHAYPPAGTPPTVYIVANRFAPFHALRTLGVGIITVPDERWMRCDLKTTSLIPNAMAKQRAVASGAFEGVFVRDGIVAEGAHNNVFAVVGGEVRTHPLSPRILQGVTRDVVLELAAETGHRIREIAVRREELDKADEVFLTGTTADVLPVVQVDGHPVGDGRPGPVAHALYEALAARLYRTAARAMVVLLTVLAPALVACAGAQTPASPAPPVIAARPAVRAALDKIRVDNAWTLDQQVSICEIPAPPFGESRRAEEFRRRLVALGLTDARIDAEGNVIARRRGALPRGRPGRPTVVLSGHLDTVFPESTDVTVTRQGTLMKGPGIGDDCRGLAVVLAVARAFASAGIQTQGDILFVGTVGEEGPGNLRGVRHLFTKEMKDSIDYFISVDGTGTSLTNRAVGSHRYRVTYEGPGGHSYGAFGMPNPAHALGRAIAGIAELRVPREPKTTFNVGVIEGGTSVNSIPASAAMDVDLRSESPAALDSLDAGFRAALHRALDAEHARWPQSEVRLRLRIDTTGIRPAGTQPDTTRIVRAGLDAARALGFTSELGAGSTDANLPMSLGISAMTIDGGGDGRGSHSLAEEYDDGERGWLGPQWAGLVVLSLVGVR
jgi:tripeptide aminopeptidase